MTYAELTRNLKRLGIVFRRQASRSHEIWVDPSNDSYTIIPHHSGKDIRKGTVAKILKDLGLTQDDLRRA